MRLYLKRTARKENYTIGKLYVNGQPYCDVIEDKDRGLSQGMSLEKIMSLKVKDQTAIPTGDYTVIVNMSTRFKRILPLICGVKGFDGIRMHNGVDENSTSGCLVLGDNKTVGKVTNGRGYMNDITEKIVDCMKRKEKVTIHIE